MITSGSRRTLNGTFRQTVELETAKQTVGTSTRLQKMNVRTLWRGWPLRNERSDHYDRLRAMDAGALTTLELLPSLIGRGW